MTGFIAAVKDLRAMDRAERAAERERAVLARMAVATAQNRVLAAFDDGRKPDPDSVTAVCADSPATAVVLLWGVQPTDRALHGWRGWDVAGQADATDY